MAGVRSTSKAIPRRSRASAGLQPKRSVRNRYLVTAPRRSAFLLAAIDADSVAGAAYQEVTSGGTPLKDLGTPWHITARLT